MSEELRFILILLVVLVIVLIIIGIHMYIQERRFNKRLGDRLKEAYKNREKIDIKKDNMTKNRKGFVYIPPKLIVKYKDANYIERLSRIICNATEPKGSDPYDNQLDELYLSYLFSEAFIEDKPFNYRKLWKVFRTENTYKELDEKLKRLKNKEAPFNVYDFEEEVTTYESISNYCLERLMYCLGGREENVEKMRDRVKKRLNAYLSLETAIRLNDVLSWLDENGVEIK